MRYKRTNLQSKFNRGDYQRSLVDFMGFADGQSSRLKPLIQLGQGTFADHGMALLFVPDAAASLLIQRLEEVERDVRGLKVLCLRVADVIHQGAEGRGT